MSTNVKTTNQDLYRQQTGERRRTAARQQIIALNLRLNTLLEPADQAGKDAWWSERVWIEGQIADLNKVVEEPIA